MANENNTGDGQGAETQTAQIKTEETTVTSTAQNEGKQPETKTFTQEDVNRLIAKERKSAETKAKMTEDERLKAENEELKGSLRIRDAKDDFQAAIGKTAKSANLLFSAAQNLFEFSATGKVTNMADVIKQLKADYPEQFEVNSGSADGGTGKTPTPNNSLDNQIRQALGYA